MVLSAILTFEGFCFRHVTILTMEFYHKIRVVLQSVVHVYVLFCLPVTPINQFLIILEQSEVSLFFVFRYSTFKFR